MKVAAVILNYNDGDGTIEAVRRIEAFESIDTVIVVDNASTDGSAEHIRAKLREMNRALMESDDEVDDDSIYHRYMLVESDKNGGYGYGNNIGVQYAYEIAGAELVLIANPDAVFSEEIVTGMAAIFDREHDAAAVGALMAGNGAHVTYQDCMRSAWPLRSVVGELLNSGPICRRLFRCWLNYDASHFIGHSTVEVDAVHGSLLMVDADRFLALGGFDEEMFLYGEENVLAAKLKEMGYKTFLLLNGSYRHEGSASITGTGHKAVERERLRQQSEQYYYRTYLNASMPLMGFVHLFQAVVMLETSIAEHLHLIK